MYIIGIIALVLIVGYFLLTFILGSYAELKSYKENKQKQIQKDKTWRLHELKTTELDDFAVKYKLTFDSIFQENKITSINDLKEKIKSLPNHTDKDANAIIVKAIKSGLISSEIDNDSDNAKIWIKGHKYNEVDFFFPSYKLFVQNICVKNGYQIDYNPSKEELSFRGDIFEKAKNRKIGEFIYKRAHNNSFMLKTSEKTDIGKPDFYQVLSVYLNDQFIERNNLKFLIEGKLEKMDGFNTYSFYKKILIKPIDQSVKENEYFFIDLLRGRLYNYLKLSDYLYFQDNKNA